MKEFARAFLKTFSGEGDAVEEACKALRGSRGGVAYRASLAARFGYSSYAKFSRACLMCYGMEPTELERVELEEAVLEILTEPDSPPCAEVERENSKFKNQNSKVESGSGAGVCDELRVMSDEGIDD
jgi:hypothetical protein